MTHKIPKRIQKKINKKSPLHFYSHFKSYFLFILLCHFSKKKSFTYTCLLKIKRKKHGGKNDNTTQYNINNLSPFKWIILHNPSGKKGKTEEHNNIHYVWSTWRMSLCCDNNNNNDDLIRDVLRVCVEETAAS